MAGPLDLRGTATIKNGAGGTLNQIAGGLSNIGRATGAIKPPPALAATLDQLRRLRTEYDQTAQAMGRYNRASFVLEQRKLDAMRDLLRRERAQGRFTEGVGYGYVARETVARPIGAMITDGADMYRLRKNMGFAGVAPKEVDAAEDRAWTLTGVYKNMSAVEIMELINDARGIYGSQATATEHVDPIARAGSFLKAYQGGAHAGDASDLLRELNALMKSGEIAGRFTPEALAKHIDQMLAMKVVYGNQVKVSDYLAAQRTAGAPYLASSDKWRYGYFPAMVQEYGPGAGVQMATTAQKVLADTGNKKYAIEAQTAMGLRDEKGEWRNAQMFGENPLEWVNDTMIPALERNGVLKRDEEGHVLNPTELIQAIGKMFPDRQAAKEMTELIVQMSKLKKNADLMEKVHTDFTGYTQDSLDYWMGSLTAQAQNLGTIFGSTLVPATLEAAQALGKLMSGATDLAKQHPVAGTVAGAVGAGVLGLGALMLLRRFPMLAGGLLGLGLSGGSAGVLLGGMIGSKVFSGGVARAGGRAVAAGAGAAGAGILSRGGLAALGSAGLAMLKRWLPFMAIGGALGAGWKGYDTYQKGGSWLDILKSGAIGGAKGALGLDILEWALGIGEANAADHASGVKGQPAEAPPGETTLPEITVDQGAGEAGTGLDLDTSGVQALAEAQGLADQIRQVFASIDLSAAGQAMMASLAAGITAGGAQAVAAANNVASQVRAAGQRIPLNTGPNMQPAR